jgi:mitochondrial fission protein ELM1
MSEQEYFQAADTTPPRFAAWVVSDGTVGMEIQSRGLATALGIEPVVKQVNPRLPWRVLPAGLWLQPFMALGPDSDPLEPPWPDLLIGTGRIAAAFSAAIREASGGATFTVQMQNPYLSPERFDLIVVPEHDGFAAPNAITTLGSIHAVTPARLEAARAAWAPRFAHLRRPLVAVLVGGSNRRYQLTSDVAAKLGSQLAPLTAAYGLAVTPSRRTGKDNEAALISALAHTDAYVWDGVSENPYLGLLALADAIIVTSDSTNMATEALATGRPVHVVHLPGRPGKFGAFHDLLRSRGYTRPFRGQIEAWSYEPPDDTARVAALVRRRLDQREQKPDRLRPRDAGRM